MLWVLEVEGGRWSIYQCSTQFPIDIECRLHVEPITDRQFGSHPPLAKTGLASTLYRLPIIRKGGISARPDSSPDCLGCLPGYFPIISRLYCNVGSALVMQYCDCEVGGGSGLTAVCVRTALVSSPPDIIQTLKPHSIQLGQGHCLASRHHQSFFVKKLLHSTTSPTPSVPS